MNSTKPILVISSGAGISAESGIRTFRDADGLWENYPVMDVASADGFRRNPELVHQFYNERRHQLINAKPNDAHRILAELEKDYDVYVITQNVDDLHERAGSSRVLHLHGELMKIRSVSDPDYIESLDIEHLDTTPATRGKRGDLMRPHIVFFQEPVPLIEEAARIVSEADIFVVIGTSLVVYPAAGLLQCVRPGTPIYYIDPNPASTGGVANVTVIKKGASEGLRELVSILEKGK
ncbi:MAG: NAD-dependent deacylase [Muribaculaceae bacterium]|nr:NAD-dependent deacylase [Muribaculaceae bacterium]MDE6537243.1 NAD-dependent deacylase [Muribaculaceae bacterium]MDE6866844.1 NAD-dependent deacylase [Muribaculaceae bacterium]